MSKSGHLFTLQVGENTIIIFMARIVLFTPTAQQKRHERSD